MAALHKLQEGVMMISGRVETIKSQKSKCKKTAWGFKVSVGERTFDSNSEPEITFDVSIIQLLVKLFFS